jgi:threonine dehydratase
MLAGVSLAVKALRPDIKVIGVEPLGADDAKRSFLTGQHVRQHQPDTIADGLRTTLGTLNFALIRDYTDDIVTVTDAQITAAMKVFMVRAKALVEPSGIVGLAAVMADPSRFAKQQVGIVISGGNVDLEHPVWL